MGEQPAVGPLGFTLPTPAYLAGVILFSVIGFAAYRYGRKTSRPYAKWFGVALMLYPYLVPETWMLYAVGAGLCAGLYWFRE
jgi:predicted membrane-bound mannosyltransferase